MSQIRVGQQIYPGAKRPSQRSAKYWPRAQNTSNKIIKTTKFTCWWSNIFRCPWQYRLKDRHTAPKMTDTLSLYQYVDKSSRKLQNFPFWLKILLFFIQIPKILLTIREDKDLRSNGNVYRSLDGVYFASVTTIYDKVSKNVPIIIENAAELLRHSVFFYVRHPDSLGSR